MSGLSVNPTNPNELSASFAVSVTNRYSLSNPHAGQWNGSTWANITGNLPTVGAVSRVVYGNASLFAATDFGVYGSIDNGTTWTVVATGLPAVQVMDINVALDAITVVTHGRGAWKLPISATTLTVAPASIPSGGFVTATWSGVAAPTATDWIGLYPNSAAADTSCGTASSERWS